MKFNKKYGKDFDFGVATSAYQIEGAYNEDGRSLSIWDTFSRTPGKVYQGHNGDVACDHYHRYKEDVALMKDLGIRTYSFSISWPRIFPEKGTYNQKGMDFYIALLKELKEAGIQADVTLYHWDLPEWVQAEGGWISRDIIPYFLEYAEACVTQLGSYVHYWTTHNEPFCSAFLSYYEGVHAPGHTNMHHALLAAHHILLSHGLAVKVLKEKGGPETSVSITLNLTATPPLTKSQLNLAAASHADGYNNRWFLDAVLKGVYPSDMIDLFSQSIPDWDFIQEGDMEIISTPLDFLGINYYTRQVVKYDDDAPYVYVPVVSDYEKTAMEWDVAPECLIELIQRVRTYTKLPIIITENGSAWRDILEEDKVHDRQRIKYLEAHLEAIHTLNEQGANIIGYYAWSLLDNFEWSFGYAKRFGLVYIDYDTLARIPKDSFFRYKEIIAHSAT